MSLNHAAFVDPARHPKDENGSLVHLDDPMRLNRKILKAWLLHILDPDLPESQRFCFLGTISRHQAGQVLPPATIQFEREVTGTKQRGRKNGQSAPPSADDDEEEFVDGTETEVSYEEIDLGSDGEEDSEAEEDVDEEDHTEIQNAAPPPTILTSRGRPSQPPNRFSGSQTNVSGCPGDADKDQPQESTVVPASLTTLGCSPHAYDQSDKFSDEGDDSAPGADDRMDVVDDEEQDDHNGAPTFTLSPRNNVKVRGRSLLLSFQFLSIALAVPSRRHRQQVLAHSPPQRLVGYLLWFPAFLHGFFPRPVSSSRPY